MEWIVLPLLVVAGLVLLALFWLVGQLIALPFHLLGFVLKLVGFALALPFLLLGAVLALVLGGLGLAVAGGVLLLPLVPVLLVVWGLVWLLRRRPRPAH